MHILFNSSSENPPFWQGVRLLCKYLHQGQFLFVRAVNILIIYHFVYWDTNVQQTSLNSGKHSDQCF